MQRQMKYITSRDMKVFQDVDGRFRGIVQRIRVRYITIAFFVALSVLSYAQPSTTSVLAWWDQFTYGRLIFSAWLLIGASVIWLVDDPFTYFLGTLPFLAYIGISFLSAFDSGSYYPIAVLLFTYLLMLKVYTYEDLNGGH